jgi:hypothetical protein
VGDHSIVTISIPLGGLAWIQGALILRDTRIDDFRFTLPYFPQSENDESYNIRAPAQPVSAP